MITKFFKWILSYLYTLFLCNKVEKYMHKHKCSLAVALEETTKQEFLVRKLTDKKFIYRFVSQEEGEQALKRLQQYSRGNV